MKTFKHKNTGEIYRVKDDAAVLKLLTSSPSWEEVKDGKAPAVKEYKATEVTTKIEPGNATGAKDPAEVGTTNPDEEPKTASKKK